MHSKQLGRLEVVELLDASGSFGAPWEAVFPNADSDDWAAARILDPDAFGADGNWRLHFHCFAIRRPGGRVSLVDTGVGPSGSPASPWAPVPGRLPRALTEAGIAAEDVDAVVMTHLHEDHVGWAVRPDGVPLFPNASYVVQRDEVRYLDQQSDRTIWDYVVAPLRDAGQLAKIDGRAKLAGGRAGGGDKVTAIPTPGHTVGHQSVLVDGPRQRVILAGDVLVHAVQMSNPAVHYIYEKDKALAAHTRRKVLAMARRENAVLATAHLTDPFMR